MDRRVYTEECEDQGLDSDNDSEFYRKQMQFYNDSSDQEEENDEDQYVDHQNYKGIYIDEDPGSKFQDPETGAHFDYSEMVNRLQEVEVEMRKSQERDQATIKKNKELLQNNENEINKQIFKSSASVLKPTENQHFNFSESKLSPKHNNAINKKINEVLNCKNNTHSETQRLINNNSLNKLNNKNPLVINSIKSKLPKKNEKAKTYGKKVSDLILLKKKGEEQKSKGINLIIGGKDRDSKQIFKTAKTKSKYQKYLIKNKKALKAAYPTIDDKSTRNTIVNQFSQDKKLYELLMDINPSNYNDLMVTMQKPTIRKSSRSNTSRKTTEVNGKKSFTKMEKPQIDINFLSQTTGQHFRSFHNGMVKLTKHTPKCNKSDKLYSIDKSAVPKTEALKRLNKSKLPESDKKIPNFCKMNKDSISNYELSNQCTLPPNIQSLCNIPSSTKAVNLNILTPFYDSKHRSSAKGKARCHKKSYTKKSDSLSKRMSGIADPTIKAVEEYPSPYKVSKKSKDFLSQFTISGNENSSYLKSKHLNSIINNLSIESNCSKINKRTTSNAGVIIKGSRIQKLLGAKKQHISKNSTHTNRKKKARSKTKTEKSVVFVMPGQHIANQFIHYCK